MNEKRWDVVLNFLKYGLVGGLGTLTSFLFMIISVEVFQLSSLIGTVIGFIFSLIISFFLNYMWTFSNSNSGNIYIILIKYSLVSLSGLLLNLLIMYILNYVLNVWYIYAQMVSTVAVPIHNYIFNRFWTFNQKERGGG
jgi:putative flippase GtrA